MADPNKPRSFEINQSEILKVYAGWSPIILAKMQPQIACPSLGTEDPEENQSRQKNLNSLC